MKSSHPRISVIITSCNQKDYLIEAIESVIHQTTKPHEIIIADDHSTDGSVERIQDYIDRYPGWIKGVFQESNIGIPRNRNAGLHQVTGNYVAILDGDDRYLSQNLEQQFEALIKYPEAGCVYSNLYFIDAKGTRACIRDAKLQPSGDIFTHLATGKMGLLRSMLARYSLIKEVGFLDARFPKYDGFVLTLRLAKCTKFAYVLEPLAEYRVHERNDSRSFSHRQSYHYLKTVYAEILNLTQDLPPQEIQRIRAVWLWILDRQCTLTQIQEGKRIRAIVNIGWAFVHNPWRVQNLAQRLNSFIVQKLLPKSDKLDSTMNPDSQNT